MTQKVVSEFFVPKATGKAFIVKKDQVLRIIVLPAATWLERDHMSVEPPFYLADGNAIMTCRHKIVQVGETWDDWKIIVELGRRLGFGEYLSFEGGNRAGPKGSRESDYLRRERSIR